MKKTTPILNIHVREALEVLRLLGFPRAQLNERSALTLLALLDLQPETAWHDAANPLRGVVPMMDFFLKHYGKRYEENTRETVRRQTIHQFLQASLVVLFVAHSNRNARHQPFLSIANLLSAMPCLSPSQAEGIRSPSCI